MKYKILCSAVLAFGLGITTVGFSQNRSGSNAGMNAIEEFDFETETELDMELGEDGIPYGFDLLVNEATAASQEEEESWEAEEVLSDEATSMASVSEEEFSYVDMAFGSVDAATVDCFEDFEAYFENFDGTEWTDELIAEGIIEDEEAELNEEELKPLKQAIENLEFQLEADWSSYSKDEPSEVSVDF